MSADALLSRLDGVRRTGDGRWLAKCPAHEDRRPSLSVRELPDGRVLLHDFGGCGADAVIAAAGLQFSDLFPEPMHGAQPCMSKAPRIPAGDILKAVATEIWVVACAGADFAAGRQVSREDRERLHLAIQRLNRAVAVADGRGG